MIKAEVISYYPKAHTAVVRFTTDTLAAEDLDPQLDAQGNVMRNARGKVLHCAGDRNVLMPVPMPTGQALKDFLAEKAALMGAFFATFAAVADPAIDTSMAGIAALFPDAILIEPPKPEPAPAPTPAPAPGPEQVLDIIAKVEEAVQTRLEGLAKSLGYESLLSACSYAASEDPKFQREGKYCVMQRDTHWRRCYELLAHYQGLGVIPALDDVMPQMPNMEYHP